MTIHRMKSVVLLGLHIDEFLSWGPHVNLVKNKLNSALYLLNQLKHTLSTTHLKMLYYALFHSHLNYGLLLWSNTKTSNLNYILKLQKKAIKCIYHGRNTSFSDSKILNVYKLRTLSLYKFMYRYSRKQLPTNIHSLFTINSDIHTHNTRQANVPHVSKFRYKQTLNCFLNQGPLEWINLPINIKNLVPSSFKTACKTYLINVGND